MYVAQQKAVEILDGRLKQRWYPESGIKKVFPFDDGISDYIPVFLLYYVYYSDNQPQEDILCLHYIL